MLPLMKFSKKISHGSKTLLTYSRYQIIARVIAQVNISTCSLQFSETEKFESNEVGGVPVAPVIKEKFGYVENDTGYSLRDKEAPGLFFLNTLSIPPVLQTNLSNYLKEFPRKVLEADGTKLSRHLKNRGRPTARTWKKFKESKRAKKAKDRENLEAQLHGAKPVRVIRIKDLEEEDEEKDTESDEEGGQVNESEDEQDSENDLSDDNGEMESVEDQDETSESVKEQEKKKKEKSTMKVPNLSEYKVIRYNRRETAAFASSRVPACFGSTSRVFHEIAKRQPDFKPETLLDFGSGVGTAVWAAHEHWGDSLKEYQCIDISEEMNKTAELLLRGGSSLRKSLHIPGVYFKRFLPVSNRITYDIVVAAYSLSELPFAKLRKAALLNLWRKADRFLVIVEYGNNEGFEVTLEARNLVVKDEHEFPIEEPSDIPNIDLGPEDDDEIPTGHVFAPCPHDLSCERSDVETRKKPCSFEQRVQLSLAQERSPLKRWSHAKESFSFIVLEKGQRSEHEDPWPRILEPIKKRKRHVITQLCCGNGEIKRQILTLKKDSDIYKCVRHCNNWGDLMPSPESRIRPVKHGPKVKKKNRWKTWEENKIARNAESVVGEDDGDDDGLPPEENLGN